MNFKEKTTTIFLHPLKALDIIGWKMAYWHVRREAAARFSRIDERFPRDHYAWKQIDGELNYQRFCVQENNLVTFLRRHISVPLDAVIEIGAASDLFLSRIDAKEKIGVNVLPECIAQLERQGITGRLSDGTRIPASDNEADAVICFETLEHVKNPIGMMLELERIVKPGGLLLLSIPWAPLTRVVARFHNGRDRERPEAENHVFEFSPRDFNSLLSYTNLATEAYSKLDNYQISGIMGKLAEKYFSENYFPAIQAYALRKKNG